MNVNFHHYHHKHHHSWDGYILPYEPGSPRKEKMAEANSGGGPLSTTGAQDLKRYPALLHMPRTWDAWEPTPPPLKSQGPPKTTLRSNTMTFPVSDVIAKPFPWGLLGIFAPPTSLLGFAMGRNLCGTLQTKKGGPSRLCRQWDLILAEVTICIQIH